MSGITRQTGRVRGEIQQRDLAFAKARNGRALRITRQRVRKADLPTVYQGGEHLAGKDFRGGAQAQQRLPIGLVSVALSGLAVAFNDRVRA